MANCVDTYKDSGIEWIGKIPHDWQFAKLVWCSKFINGYAFDSTQMDIDGEVPVVRIGDIQNGKVTYDTCLKVDNNNDLEQYTLQKDDIVIAMSGATTGKLAIVDDDRKAYINQRVGIIRGNYNKFIKYCLDNDSFLQYVGLLSAGSAQPNISMGNILDYKIPYISHRVKQAIADYLDRKCSEIDKIVEIEKAVIEKLKEYKQSIITEAVTKGLDKSVTLKDSGIEWIGKIPQHWEAIRIKNVAWLKGRIGWQGLKSDEYQETGAYLITGTDFDNGRINWNTCVHITQERFDEAPEIHIRENDLLITKDGTVGKVALALNCPKDVSLNSGVLLIRNTKDIKYISKYLYYVLLSDMFWNWFTSNLNGNSTIIHLYQEQFYNFSFSYPTIEEQQQIADYLDKKCGEIDKAIADKEQLIEKFTEYKKSLIYECVTGKKEVA